MSLFATPFRFVVLLFAKPLSAQRPTSTDSKSFQEKLVTTAKHKLMWILEELLGIICGCPLISELDRMNNEAACYEVHLCARLCKRISLAVTPTDCTALGRHQPLEAAVRVGFKSMENSLILVSLKTIIINASCHYRQESMEQGSCTLNALQYTSADTLLQGCSGC